MNTGMADAQTELIGALATPQRIVSLAALFGVPRPIMAARIGKPSLSWQACLVCLLALVVSCPALADVRPQTMNGPPLLPIPTYEEVGIPKFVMPEGTPLFMPNTSPGNVQPPFSGPGKMLVQHRSGRRR